MASTPIGCGNATLFLKKCLQRLPNILQMPNVPDSILDFAVENDRKKCFLHKLLLGSCVLFVLFILFELWPVINLPRRLPESAIVLISFMFVLPIAGIILLKLKKKSAWILTLFYYEFIIFITTADFIKRSIARQGIGFYTIADIKADLRFALAATILLLLISKDIRAYLSVTPEMLLTALLTATAINLVLVFILVRI
jgi:hypothetical protein